MPNDGKLRIFFRGLCVFYFYPYDETKKKLAVLLVDARTPETLLGDTYYYNKFQDPIPHLPTISIPITSFAEGHAPPNQPKYLFGDEYFSLPLTKYIVDITDIKGISLSGAVTKSLDFDHLIPNIYSLVDNAEINPDSLDVSKLSKLSAFLNIEQGELGIPNTTSPDPRRAAELIRTSFSPYDKDAQLYANCVYCDINIPRVDNEYYFKIRFFKRYSPEPIDGGRPTHATKEFTLKLDKNGEDPIPGHIFVSNMPESSISLHRNFHNDPDRDFELTYQVLKKPVYEPLPRRVIDPDEQQSFPPLFCNIAQFES